MKSMPNTPADFSPVFHSGQMVQLYNTYRGIPVMSAAEVCDISQENLFLRVEPRQAVCLFLESRTSMFVPEPGINLKAAVINVDIADLTATLNSIRIDVSPERRTLVRVQPEEIVAVNLVIEGCTLTAKLADISLEGMGIFSFDTYIYCTNGFSNGSQVLADLHLPGITQQITCTGQVVHTAPRKDPRLHRLGIRVFPDQVSQSLMREYIDIRSAELNRELQFAYESMLAARDQRA